MDQGQPALTERTTPRLARFLSGDHVLEVHNPSTANSPAPMVQRAVGMEMGGDLAVGDGTQDAVFVRHVLETLPDYRHALQEWLRVLKTGGYLIVVVPHQFLYERKAQPPSLWNPAAKRFYTCASLLREIEEALAPSLFRVRLLEDLDEGFDYSADPKTQASGSHDIVCVLEKISPPSWSESIFKDQVSHPGRAFRRQPSGSGLREPIKVFSSARAGATSILAIKLDHRGDFIMANDGCQALRRNFPDARLTLACGPWNVADAEALGLFDRIVPFALFPENASQGGQPFKTRFQAQHAFIAALGSEVFDLAIDLRWDEDTRFLLECAPAHRRAGFGVREVFDYLDIAVAFRRETVEGQAYQRLIGAERFSTPMLDQRGYAIVMSERWEAGPAFLVFGPYEALAAGDYWIDILIQTFETPFTLAFDITADGSNTILSFGEIEVTRADRVRVPLTLGAAVIDLEVRLKAGAQPVEPFRFMGCIVRHAGSLQGVHQREAMLALVSVATARMLSPYAEAEGEDVR